MSDRPDADAVLFRPPTRRRGIDRFEVLLDATAWLLAERFDENISIAQIAEKAGVPLASVYHFFPNRNAAFVALAQRFQRQLHELALDTGEARPLRWQDVIESRQRSGAKFLNDNPAALRLFLGAGVSVEVRNTDLQGNLELARARAASLRAMFETTTMADLETWLAVSIALVDGIWALSYSLHGRITDDYVDEGVRASVLYLRSYLPEILEPRSPHFRTPL
jgi:AcrR family transcriptional regulator